MIAVLTGFLLFVSPILVEEGLRVEAAVVKTKAGSRIVGEVVKKTETHIVIKTEEGRRRKISRERIRKSRLDRDLENTYRKRRAGITDRDAEAHFRLAVWCRSVGLFEQWRSELETAVAIDPDHRRARVALGYKKVNGRWVKKPVEDDRDVPSGSENDSSRSPAGEDGEIRALFKTVIKEDGPEDRGARRKLKQRRSEELYPHVMKFMDHSKPEVRRFCLELASDYRGRKVTGQLVRIAAADPTPELRWKAWELLKKQKQETVSSFLSANLDTGSIVVRIRLALLLKEFGEEETTGPLLKAYYASLVNPYNQSVVEKPNPRPGSDDSVAGGKREKSVGKKGPSGGVGPANKRNGADEADRGEKNGDSGNGSGEQTSFDQLQFVDRKKKAGWSSLRKAMENSAGSNREVPSTEDGGADTKRYGFPGERTDYGQDIRIWALPGNPPKVPPRLKYLEQRVLHDALATVSEVDFGTNIRLWYWWWNKYGNGKKRQKDGAGR